MAIVSDDDAQADANDARSRSARRRQVGNEDATLVDLNAAELLRSATTAGASDRTPPTEAEIAAVAYAIFEERGGEYGHDQDDWFEAERRLEERRTKN